MFPMLRYMSLRMMRGVREETVARMTLGQGYPMPQSKILWRVCGERWMRFKKYFRGYYKVYQRFLSLISRMNRSWNNVWEGYPSGKL
jgi:hypothetical protein